MAVDTKASAWNLSHAYENGTGASRMDFLYKVTNSSSSHGDAIARLMHCIASSSNMNGLVLGTLCITAIVFLILMTVIERRSSFKLHWFKGKVGPVVPLNLLDGYENRFAYSMAFGITTSYFLLMIFKDVESILGQWVAIVNKASSPYVSLFLKAIATVVIATSVYPLFVCIGTKYKKWGALFGFVYSTAWFCLFLYKYLKISKICYSMEKKTMVSYFFSELPQCLCSLLLMLYFLRRIIYLFNRSFRMNIEEQSTWTISNSHMYQHVKILLQRRDICNTHEVDQDGFIPKVIAKLKRMYKPKREFKYSTRIICIFVVSFFAIYMVTVLLIDFGYYLDANSSALSWLSIACKEELRTLTQLWIGCFFVAIMASTLKTWIILLNMLTWYRYHMTLLRQGDKVWLPKLYISSKTSLTFLTVQSMKFAGFQVAYAVLGYIVCVLVLFLSLFLFVTSIYCDVMMRYLYKLWPVFLIALTVALTQWMAARYCFLAQKGKVFAIDNRKAFNITSYYLFFFNIFLGAFSFLFRMLKGLIIGILFLERVQKSILPHSFEAMDPGYSAYIGYILIEHMQTNPVLRVFIHLLNESAMQNRVSCSWSSTYGSRLFLFQNTYDTTNGDTRLDLATNLARFKKIRNRWNLAYTLLKNPGLVGLRRYQRNNKEDRRSEFAFPRGSTQELKTFA